MAGSSLHVMQHSMHNCNSQAALVHVVVQQSSPVIGYT